MPAVKLASAVSLLVVCLPALLILRFDASVSSGNLPGDRSAIVLSQSAVAPSDVTISGELHPISVVQVFSRLRGTVATVPFRPGDQVPAGAVVAVVRSRDLEDRRARQAAAVAAAEVELRAKEQENSQAKELFATRSELAQRDLIPRREAEDAAAAWKTAQAAEALARAHLAQQRAMMAQTRALAAVAQAIAPAGGEVLGRVEPGEPVVEGGAVMTIGDTSRMKLVARIPRAQASGLRRAAWARIFAGESAERAFTGHVSRLTDIDGDTIEVEIVFANRARALRSGARVEARIEISRSLDSVSLP